jgi:membrane protease YdiL (CAAX protease family)
MTRHEIRRLGEATRDPAVSLFMLLPLALLHLSGRHGAQLETFFLVESVLEWAGSTGITVLWILLAVCFLWAVGRIQALSLPWRGGAVLILLEGLVWAVVLGPGLMALTRWLPLAASPLWLGEARTGFAVASASLGSVHTSLAVAAGAGLYEELLFRLIGLGAVALALNFLFRHFAAELTSRRLALFLALLFSAFTFAAAHGLYGNTQAFEPDVLAFRTIAGLSFGLLFIFRGLAVCAYAHFAYDAIYLLLPS